MVRGRTTLGNENKINEKQPGSDAISGTQKLFPLSLPTALKELVY